MQARWVWVTLGAAAVFLVVGLVVFAYHQASAPLGPALSLPTATMPAEAGFTPVVDGDETGGEERRAETIDKGQEIKKGGSAEQITKPVCGGPQSMLILGIGADSSGYRYGLADVIRIVRLDFVDKRITSVSLPRDLWIELPDIGLPAAYTHGKLNQAYLFGMPGMGYYAGADGGPGTLARAIQHNYGLSVDHYAAVNMPVFEKMVDALGGVTVDLPNPIYIGGKPENGILFAAGRQHLDGATALDLARTRRGYSDFFRQNNQSLLIIALAQRALSPAIFSNIPGLVKAFEDQVLTDLSLEQISQAACLLTKVERDDIVQTQLPREILQTGSTYSPIFRANTSIVSADRQEVSEVLGRFAAGTWP
jgi:LCP family protein required for cell wall assembly